MASIGMSPLRRGVRFVAGLVSGGKKPLLALTPQEGESLCASALANIIQSAGRDVLTDPAALQAALRREHLPEIDILRLCLFSHAHGFQELVQTDDASAQAELDAFLRNAASETGLSRTVLISLAKDVCYALGLPYLAPDAQTNTDGVDKDSVFVFPASVYSVDLERLKHRVNEAMDDQEGLGSEDLNQLIQLARIGIPAAKYLLGRYLFLQTEDIAQNELLDDFQAELDDPELRANRGLGYRLLAEAAEEGDPRASGLMGDIHFFQNQADDWTRAFGFYTGYGSLAMTKARKARIVSILNRGRLNRSVTAACAGMFLLMALFVFLSPASMLFPVRLVAGIIALAINLGILVFMLFALRKEPYSNYDGFALVMFCVWAAYLLIRLV